MPLMDPDGASVPVTGLAAGVSLTGISATRGLPFVVGLLSIHASSPTPGQSGMQPGRVTLLDRPRQIPTEVTWLTVVKIVVGIGGGLHFLHRHPIFHPDVNPQNILLDDNVEPKLSDVGTAKKVSEAGTLHHSRSQGTSTFKAPERRRAETQDYSSFSEGHEGATTGQLVLTSHLSGLLPGMIRAPLSSLRLFHAKTRLK
jgi:serine/threonine protein kinase